MSRRFPPVVLETLEWISSELPEELRNDSFARNYHKHCCNLTDVLNVLGDQKATILDIGSGIGIFPGAMVLIGHNVTSAGIAAGDHAWMKSHGVATVSLDILAQSFPFPDESFDLVTMFDVIEHLHGSPRHALGEIFRILRRGGHIVVETLNIANLRRRLVLLLGRNPTSVKGFYESEYPYKGHVYEYTKSDLEKAIRWSGFEITESKYSNVANRFHRTERGYAPGLKLQSLKDGAMFGYLAICKVVPSFKDALLCIGMRPTSPGLSAQRTS